MKELIVTVFIWGFSFALSKKALNAIGAFELVAVRLTLAFLTIALINRLQVRSQASKQSLMSFVIGAFEFAGTYLLYTLSLRYLPSGVVATLTLLTPFLTYLIGLPLGVDHFSMRALFCTILSFFGAALAIPSNWSALTFDSDMRFGVMLITLSNLMFAFGNVLVARMSQQNKFSNQITGQAMGWGALVALVVNLFLPQPNFPPLDFQFWLLPVYLGVVATGLGFYLWNQGVKKVSSTKAVLVGNFKAPLAVVFGSLWLNESIPLNLVIGLILLLLATYGLPKRQPILAAAGSNTSQSFA